jgi:hypothetical protein
MSCADDSYKADDADEEEFNKAVPHMTSAMCVPINVRFFDSINPNATEITQIRGGQSFVARVYVAAGNDTCAGTTINLTYLIQIIPNTTGCITVDLSQDEAASVVAVPISVTLIAQAPTNPLSTIYYDNSNKSYLRATITPSMALNGTSLTVIGTNPLFIHQPQANTIKVVF